ncbi:STAS/SEC14 domain-containing protein [Bernardetia sp. OM2101]|uniref:STAS/SEC14 domain-containing protein n=1 Tax=Bernardetia sp. OM2101 TaxID=3344876 RepID=UPI0035D05B89
MEFYKSDYQTINFDESKSLLSKSWTPKSEDLETDTFHNEINKVVECAEKNNVKYILDDTRDFSFTITIELQSWVDNEVFPRFIAAGLKKYAIIVSKEFISQLSIEQTMEGEKGSQTFEVQYFDNTEEARNWIENSISSAVTSDSL